MTERVLGPTGSPRRRWTLFIPLVAAMLLGLMVIAGAQAVHDDALRSSKATPTTGANVQPTRQSPAGCDRTTPCSPPARTGTELRRRQADDGGLLKDFDTPAASSASGDDVRDRQQGHAARSPAGSATATTTSTARSTSMNAYAVASRTPTATRSLFRARAQHQHRRRERRLLVLQSRGRLRRRPAAHGTFSGEHTGRRLLVVCEFSNGGESARSRSTAGTATTPTGSLNPTARSRLGVDCLRPSPTAATATTTPPCAAANTGQPLDGDRG